MKHHRTWAALGVLAFVTPTLGDFTGVIVVEDKTDVTAAAAGLFVSNLYAEFDNPADRLVLVTATFSVAGGFYQSAFGTDLAPSQFFIDLIPLTRYDTFVTVGIKVDDGTNNTALTPGSAGFTPGSFSGSWHNSMPDDGRGDPVDDRVLIAQLTTAICPSSTSISGTITVWWCASAGVMQSAEVPVQFTHVCTCPWDCQDAPNGFVDIADMFKLFGHWFAPGPCDFDGNGLGDINDLFAMFGTWGQCP